MSSGGGCDDDDVCLIVVCDKWRLEEGLVMVAMVW
jgi:hypothetical protein